jgi:hypothetical protein
MAKARWKYLWDTYRFAGFTPSWTLDGLFGEPMARVLSLTHRSKKRLAGSALRFGAAGTISGHRLIGICRAATTAFTCGWRSDELTAGSAVG